MGPGSGRGGRKGTAPICPCHCFHRRSSSHVSCASALASREPGHRGLCRPGTRHVAHVQGAGTIHAGQWQDAHLAARPEEGPIPVPHSPPATSSHGVLTTTVCSDRRDQAAVTSLQVQGKAWSCSSDSERSDPARLVHAAPAPGALSALSQPGSPSRTRRLRGAHCRGSSEPLLPLWPQLIPSVSDPRLGPSRGAQDGVGLMAVGSNNKAPHLPGSGEENRGW